MAFKTNKKNFFYFDEVQFTYFIAYAFGIISKKTLPNITKIYSCELIFVWYEIGLQFVYLHVIVQFC